MARAVIELTKDIRDYLPYLSQKIEGCYYNAESHTASFRKENVVLVIEATKITIYLIENEIAARNILDWLENILDNGNET